MGDLDGDLGGRCVVKCVLDIIGILGWKIEKENKDVEKLIKLLMYDENFFSLLY